MVKEEVERAARGHAAAMGTGGRRVDNGSGEMRRRRSCWGGMRGEEGDEARLA